MGRGKLGVAHSCALRPQKLPMKLNNQPLMLTLKEETNYICSFDLSYYPCCYPTLNKQTQLSFFTETFILAYFSVAFFTFFTLKHFISITSRNIICSQPDQHPRESGLRPKEHLLLQANTTSAFPS